ncbi:MAG: BON domain-containing protein [candidate division NC10 bacterium]|nr:BON domain-containing protein [candidate division NC10 bacterium]
MTRPLGTTVLVLAAAFLAGCAVTSGSTRESVGETIHSISVSNTIQFRYQGDRVLAPLGLRVETYRREVFVSGLVQNDAQRVRAVAIARDTPGVLAAYFVDTDLPGRPVSRAHCRAGAEQVWSALVAAVRAAGYQVEERREGRSLVTSWRRLSPSWRTLWMGSQERVRLSLFPHGHANGVVTVIAVVDRLDEGSVSWQIEREQAVLDGIREALERAAASRS